MVVDGGITIYGMASLYLGSEPLSISLVARPLEAVGAIKSLFPPFPPAPHPSIITQGGAEGTIVGNSSSKGWVGTIVRKLPTSI